MTTTDTDSAIRAWAAERRLPDAHLERWLNMRNEDRAALLSFARALRLRTGAMATALTTLLEIAARDRVSVEAVLSRREIAALSNAPGPAPARAAAFLRALKDLRYPRLKAATERLEAEIASLRLPRGVAVRLPSDLSSDELAVELRAAHGAELKRLIEALSANASRLAAIVDLLGGKREL